MPKVYNIIEIANTHGGSLNYVLELLKDFAPFTADFGVKFQPFKYDEIALPDYSWYETYKRLFFSPEQWKEIIATASKSKDVWIDVFDNYSVQILKENAGKIRGLKFQASVLNNQPLFRSLSDLDLRGMIVILNVSSFTLEQIGEIIQRVQKSLSPQEIVLQVGFQDYPTSLPDSGLSKIGLLKERFGKRASFAEHTDPKSEESIYLPVIASLLGAAIIEKHVLHSSLKTEFDFQSSVPVSTYHAYVDTQKKYLEAFDQPFINDREALYLTKSLQIPLSNKRLAAGQLLSLNDDLGFKRSSQNGLNIYEVRERVEDLQLLASDKGAGQVLKKEDFRKASIATIIACRLKSTRLPKKAILKIGDLTSIELCIKNALRLKNVTHTILATSSLDEDSELEKHTFSDSVIFHRGDPVDVIRRYLGIVDRLGIDIVIRVTGDMPYVSDDILQILLKSHFESAADYTTARKAAVGTNLEVMNAAALRKIKSFFPHADYSEYMTYYFTNNPSYFRLNFVDLPSELVRDYRLTLDFKEDLEMFARIEAHFKENDLEYDIMALFDFLDKNPEVAAINKDMPLRYKTDEKLMVTLKRETTIKQ